MILNSFVVIVTENTEVRFWSKPTDMDAALVIYRDKVREYANDPAFTAAQMEHSNKKIEDNIKMWGGDLTIPTRWISNLWFSYETKEKIKILLTHSSRT